MIEVRDLFKRYGSLTALDGLSLSIRDQEIYGLLGPNGSGKTTLINCVLALLKFDQGSIRIRGQEMRPDAYELKRELGVVPQELAIFDELSVQENIDYFCGLYLTDKKERRQRVEEAIEFTGLTEFRRFRPPKLSGGLKRRLNIACGLAQRPRLLFLDEPTVAVDPQSRHHILEGIRRLRDKGVTVLYTTHYMEEAEQLCDRVGILDHGRLLAEGTPAELKDQVAAGDTIEVLLDSFPAEKLAELEALPGVKRLLLQDKRLTLATFSDQPVLEQLLLEMSRLGFHYHAIRSEKPTLNTVFLEITGRELRD